VVTMPLSEQSKAEGKCQHDVRGHIET